ncbi:hypothetical protein ACOTH8_21510 [Achromobacter xylosoxidans]
MNTINDGGPAFPLSRESSIGKSYEGKTLRDDFAGKAMQGICAHPDTWGCLIPEIAEKAYAMADAMLAARGAQ